MLNGTSAQYRLFSAINVLGFYKTFNLGSMYVTPSVYNNGALQVMQSNGGMNNPLF